MRAGDGWQKGCEIRDRLPRIFGEEPDRGARKERASATVDTHLELHARTLSRSASPKRKPKPLAELHMSSMV